VQRVKWDGFFVAYVSGWSHSAFNPCNERNAYRKAAIAMETFGAIALISATLSFGVVGDTPAVDFLRG
jgi:hypothetical protein